MSRWGWASGCLVLGIAGLGLWFLAPIPDKGAKITHGADGVVILPPVSPVADPRLAPGAPANAHPSMAMAGNAACAACHAEISARYRGHAMAQSLGRPGELPDLEKLDPGHRNPFDAHGLVHEVRVKDKAMDHVVSAPPGPAGGIGETERVTWVLGSGQRGRSYLVGEGRLYQSPLSWFSNKKMWDLSPGYSAERQFTRAIVGGCLYCHANQPDQVSGTLNQFRMTGPQGIGCERCHGSGRAHVDHWADRLPPIGDERGKGDPTIVNPARLDPNTRDSICQQCHLQGSQRVDRRGRHQVEFRPGTDLADFWSVAFLASAGDSRQKAVGQVDQMEGSQCHKQSAGKMSCFSCHDPHGEPEAKARPGYYRLRCLSCHEPASGKKGCSEDSGRRKAVADACATCHMPRFENTDIVHAAITDHRVLRKPESKGNATPPMAKSPDGLHLFREGRGLAPADRDRALGLALARLGRISPPANRRPFFDKAMPFLDAAFTAHGDDLPVGLERSALLRALGKKEESLALARALNERDPDNEDILVELIQAAMGAGRSDWAIPRARDLAARDPRSAEWGQLLAEAQAADQRWEEVVQTARGITRVHPLLARPRMMAIEALTKLRRSEEARAEFETLLGMRGTERDGIISWYHAMRRE